MAELFGKETGVARGYGGSIHLLDVDRRFLGGWGIVGRYLPTCSRSHRRRRSPMPPGA
jgi:pyruvate dehydrogenase E1 component alpha subunit